MLFLISSGQVNSICRQYLLLNYISLIHYCNNSSWFLSIVNFQSGNVVWEGTLPSSRSQTQNHVGGTTYFLTRTYVRILLGIIKGQKLQPFLGIRIGQNADNEEYHASMPTALPWFMASHALKNKGKGETIQTSFIELDFHSNLLFKIIYNQIQNPHHERDSFPLPVFPNPKRSKGERTAFFIWKALFPFPFLTFLTLCMALQNQLPDHLDRITQFTSNVFPPVNQLTLNLVSSWHLQTSTLTFCQNKNIEREPPTLVSIN